MRLIVALFSLLLFSVFANNAVLNSLLEQQQTFLPVKEAFKFDFGQRGKPFLSAKDIADSYCI